MAPSTGCTSARTCGGDEGLLEERRHDPDGTKDLPGGCLAGPCGRQECKEENGPRREGGGLQLRFFADPAGHRRSECRIGGGRRGGVRARSQATARKGNLPDGRRRTGAVAL